MAIARRQVDEGDELNDPVDDHDELTPEERAALDMRLEAAIERYRHGIPGVSAEDSIMRLKRIHARAP